MTSPMTRMTIRAAALALSLSVAALAPASGQAAEPAPEEREAIEKIVRDYLLANPEVVEKALLALQAKRQEAEQAKQADTIAQMKDRIFNSEHQAVVGNPAGKVTLVEFFDYNCGYCRGAVADMVALIDGEPDLRVVMKEFPILSEGSVEAARVSVAVKNVAPEAYFDFHQEMFARDGQADKAKALAVVEDLGLDVDAIRTEAERDGTIDDVRESHELASALGISGTPSYVIGGEVVHGAAGYDTLAEKVESVAACGSATC